MFDGNARTIQRIASRVQRVLVVDPNPATARLLAEHMRPLGAQIFAAPTAENAYAMARAVNPQLIFVEHIQAGVDGLVFTRKIRRGDLPCREAPVIMCTAEATAEAIFGARDAGVHEFMRKPFNLKDLERRLEAVTLKPRDWIEAVGYVRSGPPPFQLRRLQRTAQAQGRRARLARRAPVPGPAHRQVGRRGAGCRSGPGAPALSPPRRRNSGAWARRSGTRALIQAAEALGASTMTDLSGAMGRADLVKRIDALMGLMAQDSAGRAA